MDIKYLDYFVKIAESGSYASVARKAYLSQPGLHKAMRSLENELGITLLEQRNHKTTVTEAGEKLLPLAKQVCLDYNRMLAAMQNVQEKSQNTFTLGHCSPAMDKGFGDYILRFIESHPTINISMIPNTERKVRQMLLSDQLDFACFLVKNFDDLEGLDYLSIKEDSWGVILSSSDSLAGRNSIKPSDMKGYTLLLPTFTNYWVNCLLELFSEEIAKDVVRVTRLPEEVYSTYIKRPKTAYFISQSKWSKSNMSGLNFVPLAGDPMKFTFVLAKHTGKSMTQTEREFWEGAASVTQNKNSFI